MATYLELCAREDALNEAFVLILTSPNPLGALNALLSTAAAAKLDAFNAECNALHGLPEPADAARYGVTMVVDAPNAKAA